MGYPRFLTADENKLIKYRRLKIKGKRGG